MKVKALANFAHASKRSFIEGRTYEVQEKSAAEFLRGGLVEIVEEPKPVVEEPKAEDKKKSAKE